MLYEQLTCEPLISNLESGTTSQEIVLSQDVSNPDEWDTFVRSHLHGSVFHLTAWQRLIQGTFGYEPKHIIARSSSGGELCGVLPLFFVRSLIFGRLLVSTPHAAYGGILANSDVAAHALFTRAREIAKELGVQFLELRSFGNPVKEEGIVQRDLYVTFRQHLRENVHENFLAIPKKTRAEIREGIRKELEFRVDAIGPDDFFNVYSRNLRDLGTPAFTRRLFANGQREFGPECKIFSTHWKGKLVGAVWNLFYKDEVVPYYGASIREYNHLAVSNFMYWMVIKYSVENGYKSLDFGRSKKGTGSFNFKKRWGMDMSDLRYQYVLIRRREMPDTSPFNPKFSLPIQIWRKLPLRLTNSVGPFISKHLI